MKIEFEELEPRARTAEDRAFDFVAYVLLTALAAYAVFAMAFPVGGLK